MQKIYLDNAATTPLLPEVIQAMVDNLTNSYGNPSSTHSVGQEAKSVLESARRKIAKYLRVEPSEIIFTSCGTESNNLIIKSCVRYLGVERIITSALEHKCVAESCREMKNIDGVEVKYLRVNQQGDVNLDQLEKLLQNSEKKTLVTLMHANNEIGNIMDIDRVASLCKQYGALFHSDTVQTIAHMDLDFSKIPLDFASCSAHKFHGPKGIGFAFIRKSTALKGMIVGGTQERNLRAGTENVSGVAGMEKALDLAMQDLEGVIKKVQSIKDYTIEQLTKHIEGVVFNGRSADKENSLFTVLNVLLPFKNPLISLELDMQGISISQGSACSSGAAKPSMVLLSVLSDEQLETTTPLRVSFSHLTTPQEIDLFVKALVSIKEKAIEDINK